MKSPLSKDTYHKSAAVYKVLAHPKRLEILSILKKGEYSVEKIKEITKLPKANLSQHLAVLRKHGLVESRKQGLNVYYRMCDPKLNLQI